MAIAGKDGDNGVVEFQFYQPENRTKWESFQKAIYDKSSNQFLGRTPKSWGQLLIFYSIFYIVLAALFAICMQGLFATLSDREPRWKLGDSLIGKNPGLGFRPLSNITEEGSLIWYNITNTTTIDKYVGLLNTFLIPYRANQTGKNFVPCSFDNPPGPNQVCETTIHDFKRCTPERLFGYNTSSPCMFLKLNRIIDWDPKYFSTPQKGMPQPLVDYINKINEDKGNERRVWITCNGVDDFDKENIKGFNYYPKGFASYYYPYKNIDNYLSPIVAVEILDITPNIIVSIECRAWAKNIEYRGGVLNRAGSVRFEIQVDREYQVFQPKKTGSQSVPKNAAIVETPKNTVDAETPKKVTLPESKPTSSSDVHNVNSTATTVITTAATAST